MSDNATDNTPDYVRGEKISPGYHRVTFDNPPLNLYDPEVEARLAEIVEQLDADPEVKVVVFDSAHPDFFIAHHNIIPGCGGLQRLWQLTGRSRALEIIASGDDYDADSAERYGWINRAVPDAKLDAVVDRFARRLASFDADALHAVKEILNEEAPPPSAAALAATNERFVRLLTREHVQERLRLLAKASPEAVYDLELNMGERIGPTPPPTSRRPSVTWT
ncbi:enoyl-CoA hydratase/isomerase family protein [Nocardia testacea]|uniref:enoyl-CoA hydratase/isomerase family protein n=1 Tax=Nocardia testacea TaxID=248551 RepID=UPI0033C2EA2F